MSNLPPQVLTLIAGSISLSVPIWLLGVQLANKPIADDYSWLHYEQILGPFRFLTWFLTGFTGRYSNGALMAVTIQLFGERSINIVPIGLTLTWVVGTMVLVRAIFGLFGIESRRAAAGGFGLGGVLCAAVILAMPSVYDTFVWYNSTCIFLASLAAFTWLCVLWLRVLKHPTRRVIVPLAVAILVVQGFAETTAAVVIVFAAIGVFLALTVPRLRATLATQLTALAAGVTGLAVVFLLPGTAARQSVQAGIFPANSILKVLEGTAHGGMFLVDILTTWRILVVLAAGVALWLSFTKQTSAHPGRFVGIGAFLAVAPVLGTALVTQLTIQSDPYRTQTLSIALAVVGIASLFAGLLGFISARLPNVAVMGAFAVVPLAAISILASLPATGSIGQAVALRASAVVARDASIRTQVIQQRSSIDVTPAPLLLTNSDTVDFSFNDVTVSWFPKIFSAYYGIAEPDLTIDKRQPSSYCLSTDFSALPGTASLAQYFGAVSCSELGRSQLEQK